MGTASRPLAEFGISGVELSCCVIIVFVVWSTVTEFCNIFTKIYLLIYTCAGQEECLMYRSCLGSHKKQSHYRPGLALRFSGG